MIGARIRQLRGEMSQEDFGALAQTSKQYVSRVERGVIESPGATFIGKWAEHFGVSME